MRRIRRWFRAKARSLMTEGVETLVQNCYFLDECRGGGLWRGVGVAIAIINRSGLLQYSFGANIWIFHAGHDTCRGRNDSLWVWGGFGAGYLIWWRCACRIIFRDEFISGKVFAITDPRLNSRRHNIKGRRGLALIYLFISPLLRGYYIIHHLLSGFCFGTDAE